MLNNRSYFISSCIIMLILLLFTSCDITGTNDNDMGTLIIHLETSGSNRWPYISMDIGSYIIRGKGPNVASFTEEVTRADGFVRSNLIEGDWEIFVKAYNNEMEPLLIAKGSQTVTIIRAEVNEVNILINPILQMLEDPITVIFSGISSILLKGTDMTIKAETSNVVDAYAWYLNETRINGAIDSSITLGSELNEGVYQLTCLVWEDNMVNSAMTSFTVVNKPKITQ